MADPAVQKAILKVMLSLPTPVLRMLSGGGVVWPGLARSKTSASSP